MDANLDKICLELDKMDKLLSNLVDNLKSDEFNIDQFDIEAIVSKNEQKEALLQALAESINNIKSNIPQSNGATLSLKEYVESLNPQQATKASTAIEKIHAVLTEGYKQLTNNNQQIMSHLGFMNDFWAKLNEEKVEPVTIYEKPKRK